MNSLLPSEKATISPRLRFPEYKEGWTAVKLKDVAVVHMGHSAPAAEIYEEGEVEYLGGGADMKRKKYRRSDRGGTMAQFQDILLSVRAPVGGGAYLTKEVRLGRGYCAIRMKAEWAGLSLYVQFLFLMGVIDLEKFSSGSTFASINKADIEDLWIPLPGDWNEVQNISSFLDAIKMKIVNLHGATSKLERFKSGLMQKLFSQDIRFTRDDGSAFPHWEKCRLGDMIEKSNSGLSQGHLELTDVGRPAYGASGQIGCIDGYHMDTPYIAIVKDGAGIGRVQLCPAKSSAIGTLDCLTEKPGTDFSFAFQLISTINFKEFSVGSTIPHIYFKDYARVFVSQPCLEEQQKIAACLTALDNKITATRDQIAQLETFKQGLLQKMFV